MLHQLHALAIIAGKNSAYFFGGWHFHFPADIMDPEMTAIIFSMSAAAAGRPAIFDRLSPMPLASLPVDCSGPAYGQAASIMDGVGFIPGSACQISSVINGMNG